MTAGRNRKQIHKGVGAFSTYISFKISLSGNVTTMLATLYLTIMNFISHNMSSYLVVAALFFCNWDFILHNVTSYITFVTMSHNYGVTSHNCDFKVNLTIMTLCSIM